MLQEFEASQLVYPVGEELYYDYPYIPDQLVHRTNQQADHDQWDHGHDHGHNHDHGQNHDHEVHATTTERISNNWLEPDQYPNEGRQVRDSGSRMHH